MVSSFDCYINFLQTLNDTVETIYEKFNYSKLVTAEYKRRALNHQSNSGFRRFQSIFCLFTKYQEPSGTEHSTIEIGKFNSELNSWIELSEIILGDRIRFSVILNHSKIYVLGGSTLNDVYLNSVSTKYNI